MPLNIPNYDKDNISFGPGVLYLGAAGDTPTVDVGAITEDGITITIENQTKDIFQGNPKLIALTFSQQQGTMIDITGIEWDFTNLSYALGAGNTTTSGAEETFAYGGQPKVEEVALHVEHQMGITGQTMNAYIWRAVSNGNVAIPLNHDEHQFPMSFKAQHSTTDWAGDALPSDEQLMKIVRVL